MNPQHALLQPPAGAGVNAITVRSQCILSSQWRIALVTSQCDPFLKTAVESWQVMAQGLGSVPEMVIRGIFLWCFTPELYASRPDYIDALAAFVRGRPVQPLDAFMRQSKAVLAHDAQAQLGKIEAPTQITFGQHDMVTSTRFADA